MSEEHVRVVKCLECNSDLPSEWAREVEQPCPNCGSTSQSITIAVAEEIALHDCLKGRVKDSNVSSKKSPRVIFQVGDSYWKDGKKWVIRNMRVDKDRDLYREVIHDPETGRTIHQCVEPLSKHQGHGSAKRAPSLDK